MTISGVRERVVFVLVWAVAVGVFPAMLGCPTGAGGPPTNDNNAPDNDNQANDNDDGAGNDNSDLPGGSLSISSIAPDDGLNLEDIQVEIAGGGFAVGVTAVLVDEVGQETSLESVAVQDAGHLTAVVPAGLAVGTYALMLTQDGTSATLADGYAAVSNVLLSVYDQVLHVADVSDLNAPEEILAVTSLQGTQFRVWYARMNYTGTRVYFSEEDGIYGCDILDCTNPVKVTPDDVNIDHYAYIDPSSAGPWLVFEGHRTGAGVSQNDVYVVNEDGTGYQRIFNLDDDVIINGNEHNATWGTTYPVFSPDGEKVAYYWLGRCGIPEDQPGAVCTNDFYTAVFTVNRDGSGRQELMHEAGERGNDFLQWTLGDQLVWSHYNMDQAVWEFVSMPATGGSYTVITPPAGDWPEYSWMAYSPLSEGMLLQRFNTAEQVYFALTGGTGGITSEGGLDLMIPNPEAPGEYLGTYIEVDWFGWQE